MKDNRLVDWSQTQKAPLKDFFAHLKPDENRSLYKKINDHDLTLVGKNIGGEFLVVCSNVKNTSKILKIYRRRWDIETCFRNMKKQGFNLEETHMKIEIRLLKLMALVSVAMLITSVAGVQEHCPYKKTVASPLYSTFTKGLRTLRNQLLIFEKNLQPPPNKTVFKKTEG